MQAFKFNFQLSNCQLFSQWDFIDLATQKVRKATDNVRVILNKIHLFLLIYDKFTASFPLINSPYLTILGSCYCKKQIDVSFLCVCPLIDDKFVK